MSNRDGIFGVGPDGKDAAHPASGAVTAEQLQRILGEFVVADPHTSFDLPKGLPSPGMMSCHYAPRTKLVVSEGDERSFANLVQKVSIEKVGVLAPNRWNVSAVSNFEWGQWGDWSVLAFRLYAGLRWLDAQGLDLIVAPLPPKEGLGRAIREKALESLGHL